MSRQSSIGATTEESRIAGIAIAEGESTSLDPPPRHGSRVERQIWAFRRYHGIGPDGSFIEEWTQQEIADALDVSRRTIDRWMNQETIASSIVGGLTRRQRLILFSMIVAGRIELAEEYLCLLSLEGRLDGEWRLQRQRLRAEQSESRKSERPPPWIQPEESAPPDVDPHPHDEPEADS